MKSVKTIDNEGVNISFNIYGNGPVTLLFVHGTYIDQTYWTAQVDYFKDDYTVVTLDLPGQGKSGRNRENWTMAEFGKDVNALIQALDLKQVILIGHSIGGDINLEAAIAHPQPIVGFIAVDIFKNAATPMPPEFDEKANEISNRLQTDFENVNEEYAQMALLTPASDKELTDKIRKAYRDAYKPMGQMITREIFKYYSRERKLMPSLQWKLYLINVDYMPTNEQALQQYAPVGYEVVHLQGTSHYPMIENPDAFNKALEKVINKIIVGNNSIKTSAAEMTA